MNKKVMGLGLGLMMVCGMMVGCTEQAIADSQKSIGFPEVRYFNEKKNLKEIIELRDNPKLICYYYTKNTMTGKYVYQGKCQGYGVPYASNYTNPEESKWYVYARIIHNGNMGITYK